MLRLTRWTIAHRRIVAIGWVALAVGVLAVSSSVGTRTANNFSLPNTGSQHATDLLASRFPAQAGDADQIVFHARTGTLRDPAIRGAVTATIARVSKLPHVTAVVSPYNAGSRAISPDGTIGFATVTFNERANLLPKAAVQGVITTAQSARSPALQVELGGQAIQQAQSTSIGSATLVGVIAAMVILLISFGSFVAMGLPMLTAALGLSAGIGLIGLTSQIIDMADFASQLALMIGLGVGIDYALFIVTRYRENYRSNGGDIDTAVETAMNTSGRAVLFAGATVVIALLGMFALGVNLLNGVAIAAALGVVLVLAASLTLLPALLRLAGRRIGETGRARAAGAGDKPGFWARWVTSIQRRPALTAVAATAVMLALAAPALGLRLGASDAGNDPAGQTTRKAYDLIAQGFGKGFNGPLQLAVKLPKANAPAALAQLSAGLRATPDVASVAAPRLNPAGDTASIQVFPRSSPQSAQTTNLVTRVRDSVLPPLERATATTVYVGGATATEGDFSHVLSSKLPLFIGIVIALSALLLMVVFRSFLIPLQAAAMNLLSIGAALGIVQAIFERGWLFGLQPGPIDAFIPVMGFAIIFGLSMDYEVFLISRIHEEWQARGDATAAIREGLAHTGRVITAAALVMVAVFGSFAFSGSRPLELFGVMMATAVFLDAFVIRMLLLPAVLELLGRRTWAFPSGLDRRLPRVAIEPPTAARRAHPPIAALEEAA
ncbi:MAG: putative drug exporter of the superfamily [Solirubrobacteraceae bacterium]|jgi:RND superfamily putative drug exporter|nr:putative drug exporter of the superfamily [Solirubrobacteraceae bacterium]